MKTKAAKAAEFALSLKQASEKEDEVPKASPGTRKADTGMASTGMNKSKVDLSMSKELEKKMVKLRNENQE